MKSILHAKRGITVDLIFWKSLVILFDLFVILLPRIFSYLTKTQFTSVLNTALTFENSLLLANQSISTLKPIQKRTIKLIANSAQASFP